MFVRRMIETELKLVSASQLRTFGMLEMPCKIT